MPGKRLLIIDDDPDTVLFLETFLQDEGFQTISASDGMSGLDKLRRESPDLVLMDVKMPKRTGVQLYRDICENPDIEKIPVVFISGVTAFQIFGRNCAPLPDPAAMLDKPLDLKILRKTIKRVIGE